MVKESNGNKPIRFWQSRYSLRLHRIWLSFDAVSQLHRDSTLLFPSGVIPIYRSAGVVGVESRQNHRTCFDSWFFDLYRDCSRADG